ncbi:hypothetical protein ACSBR1_018667 [Camellia fascicularis]
MVQSMSARSNGLLKLKGIRALSFSTAIPSIRKPVLLNNGKPVAESLVIIKYLDETWKRKNPILPKESYHRAISLRKKRPLIFFTFSEVNRKVLFLDGDEEEREVNRADAAYKILEGELKGKKFFGGETVGLLEISFGWIAIWLECLTRSTIPNSRHVGGLPRVINDQRKLPPRDNLVQYFHKIRQFKQASATKK